MKVLSIIIPVYNEERTIQELLQRVVDINLSLDKEIVVVDDGSTDNSRTIIENFIKKSKANIKFISKPNGGKGSAFKAGFEVSTGEICIVQDADLEYDPADIQRCIEPIIQGKSEVVYGSRTHPDNRGMAGYTYYLGGKLITWATNFLYNAKLTDEATGYKVFKTSKLNEFKIENNGFEWEPEITAKLLKSGTKIYEVPIHYRPRRPSEGKKINWKDGIKAIYYLIRYKIFD